MKKQYIFVGLGISSISIKLHEKLFLEFIDPQRISKEFNINIFFINSLSLNEGINYF